MQAVSYKCRYILYISKAYTVYWMLLPRLARPAPWGTELSDTSGISAVALIRPATITIVFLMCSLLAFSQCSWSICLFRSCWDRPPILQVSHFRFFFSLTSLVLIFGTGTLGLRRLSKKQATSFSVSVTFKAFFIPFTMSLLSSSLGFESPDLTSVVGAFSRLFV